jgi:hypothetical protein
MASVLGLTPEHAALIYKDIRQKRITTGPLHSKPLLIRPVDELPPLG